MLAVREFKNVPITMSILYEIEYQKIQEEMQRVAQRQQQQERERQRRSASESNSKKRCSDTGIKNRASLRRVPQPLPLTLSLPPLIR